MKDGIKNSEISFGDLLWKKLDKFPLLMLLLFNYSVTTAFTYKQICWNSFSFCMNTATLIFMTNYCSLFPGCFFMTSGVRAFSVCLISSMMCITWSCSALMHAYKEPLSSVTHKSIVHLLKQVKYAFMLRVLSNCICCSDAVTQLLLW